MANQNSRGRSNGKRLWIFFIVLALLVALVWVLFSAPSDDARRLSLRDSLVSKMGSDVHEYHVVRNGTDTRYFEAGIEHSGAVLVLLHGAGEGAVTWYPVFGNLSARRHVVAPDLPGYGESSKLDAGYDGPYYSTWLAGFLDSKGLQQVDLAGSSQGGAIALDFASRHPDRVRRLIVADPTGFAPVPLAILLQFFLLNLVPNSWLADASLSYLVANASRVDPAWTAYGLEVLRMSGGTNVFWQGRGSLAEPIPFDSLRRIEAPVLVIWGLNDTFFSSGAAHRAAALFRNGSDTILPEAGHLPFFDQPQAFSSLVNEFLDS